MRLLAPLPLLGLALALAGCGPINRGVESANQPVVSRTDYAIDLGQGSYDGLRPGEAARLGQWFDSLKLGYGDRVAIDDPAHAGGGAAREAIAATVARYGLLLTDPAPVTGGEVAGGSVRVVVSRSLANVPDCPNWHDSSTPDLTGSTMSNYGCATNGNLAAMVANPQDLVRGVADSGGKVDPRASARASSRAIKAFRDAPMTGASGLKQESSKGGS